MAVETITASIRIDASARRVWQALTEPALVAEWLGCLGFRPEIGTTFYMQPNPERRARGDVEGATHCELLELEAPVRVRFSWFMPGTPKTMVTITVSDVAASSVDVALTHSGWEQFEDEGIRALRDMLAGGWTSFVLPGLKRVAQDAANVGVGA